MEPPPAPVTKEAVAAAAAAAAAAAVLILYQLLNYRRVISKSMLAWRTTLQITQRGIAPESGS